MLTRLSAITPSPTQRCMVGKRRFADPYLLALCVTEVEFRKLTGTRAKWRHARAASGPPDPLPRIWVNSIVFIDGVAPGWEPPPSNWKEPTSPAGPHSAPARDSDSLANSLADAGFPPARLSIAPPFRHRRPGESGASACGGGRAIFLGGGGFHAPPHRCRCRNALSRRLGLCISKGRICPCA